MKAKRIKILFFINNFKGGGSQRFLINLFKKLNKNKFDISLVLTEGDIDYTVPILKDISSHTILKRGFDKNTSFLFKFRKILVSIIGFGLLNEIAVLFRASIYRNFCQIVNNEKPNIVFSINFNPILISLLLRRFGFLKNQKIKWIDSMRIQLSPAIQDRSFLLVKLLFKLLLRNSDLMIVQNKICADDLIDNFYVPKERVKIFINPIDLETIDLLKKEPVEHQFFNNDTRVIISIGRLEPQKGYQFLLSSFRLATKEIDAKLIIIGEGTQKELLNDLIKELNLEEKACIIDFQQNPYKFMYNSYLFVSSSLYEGVANVILEAIACRLPVIATNVSGIDEIINNVTNGILVPAKDINSMSEAILNLLSDSQLALSIVKENKELVQRYDLRKIIREYEEIFETRNTA